MLRLTFGDQPARDRTLDGIRAIHRRVNGRLRQAVGPFPAGTYYSAEDPDLVLWVHVTLVESLVRVYDALVFPLDAGARDAYTAETRGLALELGARDRDVPATWEALEACVAATRQSGVIAVGPDARSLAEAVLRPPLSSVIWPITRINRAVSIGMLPEDVRAQYGFQWTSRHDRRLARTCRFLAAGRRRTPRAVAWWAAARR